MIIPTHRYANRRAEQLLLEDGLSGAWGRPVMTFEGFAEDLLRGNGIEVARIEDFERRLLLGFA